MSPSSRAHPAIDAGRLALFSDHWQVTATRRRHPDLMLERLIHLTGRRTAWAIEAVAVWVIVIPLAALAMRDRAG